MADCLRLACVCLLLCLFVLLVLVCNCRFIGVCLFVTCKDAALPHCCSIGLFGQVCMIC